MSGVDERASVAVSRALELGLNVHVTYAVPNGGVAVEWNDAEGKRSCVVFSSRAVFDRLVNETD